MIQAGDVLAEIERELQAWLRGERIDPQTKDQIIYALPGTGHFKAFIDACLTEEREAPSVYECRFAALPLANEGWVVYDRLLARIVNGTFYGGDGGDQEDARESALAVAQSYNKNPASSQDMSPNGLALGLHYPVPHKREHDDEETR